MGPDDKPSDELKGKKTKGSSDDPSGSSSDKKKKKKEAEDKANADGQEDLL